MEKKMYIVVKVSLTYDADFFYNNPARQVESVELVTEDRQVAYETSERLTQSLKGLCQGGHAAVYYAADVLVYEAH